MDFEPPKFQQKKPSGSGLKSALNRGTQQDFSRFDRQDRKSARVENKANVIDSHPKIVDLKFIIWNLKPPSFVQKILQEVG